MKTVVIGGQSRDVGKTSMVAGIVSSLPHLNWTAVKITQFGHGVCSQSGEPCACSAVAPDCPYALDEERDAFGRSDTSRFLRAGARRVLWLRTPIGKLAAAMPALQAALSGDEHVILESNSVMEFLQPDVYLAILDPAVDDFKISARCFLDRADACVTLGDVAGLSTRPVLAGAVPGDPGKPCFRAERGVWLTPEIVSFIQHRLEN